MKTKTADPTISPQLRRLMQQRGEQIERLRTLARIGAETRIAQIHTELREIRALLHHPKRNPAAYTPGELVEHAPRRQRKPWTLTARARHARRMRRFWRERRKP